MKKTKQILVCGLLCIAMSGLFAQTGGQIGTLTWNVVGNTLYIAGEGASNDLCDETKVPWKSLAEDITSVDIGAGVESITICAFSHLSNLTSITVASANQNYSSTSGVMYNKDKSEVFIVPRGKTGAYTLPETVTSIAANGGPSAQSAFTGCSKLTSITVSSGLKTIPSTVFRGCSGVTAIDFKNVEIIDASAFSGCSSLTSITLPVSLKEFANVNLQSLGGITNIFIDAENPVYSSVDGVLFNKDKTTLILCPKGGSYSIPNTVKRIGPSACKGLSGVTIPESVIEIGWRAFYGSRLTSIVIPNSVKIVEALAFESCDRLTSITLPESLTLLPNGMFQNSGLKSIEIPYGVEEIGPSVFLNCDSLKSVVIPASVNKVGSSAFRAQNLTEITNYALVPQATTALTFYGVTPENVTLKVPASAVESYEAAANWGNFTVVATDVPVSKITLDKSIATLVYSAGATTQLTAKVLPAHATHSTVNWESSATGVATVSNNGTITAVAPGKTTITATADGKTTKCEVIITSQDVSVTGIKLNTNFIEMFPGTTEQLIATIEPDSASNQTVLWSSSHPGVAVAQNGLIIPVFMGTTTITATTEDGEKTAQCEVRVLPGCAVPNNSGTFGEDQKLRWMICPDGTLTITGEGRIPDYNNNLSTTSVPWINNRGSITSIVIDNGITGIGSGVFTPNYNFVTSVTLGNSVDSIGARAFYGLKISAVNLPASVKYISADAFENCPLTAMNVSENNEFFASEDGVLFNKSKMELLYFPREKAGEYAIPASVAQVGKAAFRSATKLTKVTMGTFLNTILDEAFMGCILLDSIGLSGSVETLGENVFNGCSALKSIIIPSTLTFIPGSTFRSSGLTSIILPNGVKQIGENAFQSCNSLKSVTVGALLDSIGVNAFAGCFALEHFTNYAPVPQRIDASVFDDVDKSTCMLTVVESTEEAYRAADVWKDFTNITGVDPCATPVAQGDIDANTSWKLCINGDLNITGNGAMKNFTSSANQPWAIHRNDILNVTISEGITTIASSAFSNCLNMISIAIPNAVTAIGASAFTSCTNLTSVNIPASLKTIGANAFQGSGISEVSIPATVTSIGKYAFADAFRLTVINIDAGNANYMSEDGVMFNKDKTSLIVYPAGKPGEYTIPKTVTNLQGDAFASAKKLTGVIIPESITEIPTFCFYGSGLLEITIPNSVTTMGHGIFAMCSVLKKVVFGSSITELKTMTFSENFALESIEIPASLTTFAPETFNRCWGLTKFTNHATTPQSINGLVFDETDVFLCDLYVPESAIEAFQKATVWEDFKSYRAIDYTSIADKDMARNMKFYPNPVNDVLYIETTAKITEINVYDISGKIHKTLRGDHKTLDMRELQSGYYVVRILTENGMVPAKIIKK